MIPLLVMVFQKVFVHYQEVREELSLRGLPPSLKPVGAEPGGDPDFRRAPRGGRRGCLRAIHLAATSPRCTWRWRAGGGDDARDMERLVAGNPRGGGSLAVPLDHRTPRMEFLEQTDREHNDGQLATVVLPEFIPNHWWESLLHNQTAWLIKAALLYGRRHGNLERVVIDVPFHLKK